ncbi:MAG: cation diffusion facilitator family transporter [Xanthomonadales bacterium]|nr:cation diffusion facilitator family transporter [Gammaproteobacteria bacterium]MBT8074207.1 cation diffusion facilitator family transporter [Gammaproteobacteria bacterium]NNK05059.1 cation diffusion facilitator family transporter [Xanthomonadales bacterium]
MAGSSKKAIFAALIGNSLIAVTKFAAAVHTGSAAMMSEGIHSLVDSGNQVLLLWGIRSANRPASPEFPFGHGKEIYFWSFVVAMLIFALGGTVSLYKGWQHLAHPTTIENIAINYVVLGFAVVFETAALWVALKEFNLSRGSRSIYRAIVKGKDPTLFVVVFEDSAALLGLLVALAGLIMYQLTGNPVYDAIASMGIGVVLILTALILAIESKSLLIGESADPKIVNGIRAILGGDERLITVNEVATLHMGPDFIVVTISVDFVDALTSAEIEQAVTQLTRTIKATDLRIKRVFIEAERQLDHHKKVT